MGGVLGQASLGGDGDIVRNVSCLCRNASGRSGSGDVVCSAYNKMLFFQKTKRLHLLLIKAGICTIYFK